MITEALQKKPYKSNLLGVSKKVTTIEKWMGIFFLNPHCCIKASLSQTKPSPLDLETTVYLSYSQFHLQVLIPGFHTMEFWIHVTKNGAECLDKKLGRSPKTPYCKPFSLDLCTHQNGQSQRCATDIIRAESSYSKNWFHSPCWLTLIPTSQKQLHFLFHELVKNWLIPEIPKDCVLKHAAGHPFLVTYQNDSSAIFLLQLFLSTS